MAQILDESFHILRLDRFTELGIQSRERDKAQTGSLMNQTSAGKDMVKEDSNKDLYCI